MSTDINIESATSSGGDTIRVGDTVVIDRKAWVVTRIVSDPEPMLKVRLVQEDWAVADSVQTLREFNQS